MTDKNGFFIGYADGLPAPDRRFLLGAGLAAIAGPAFAGAKLAAHQMPVGSGHWNQAKILTLHGRVVQNPYPVLRTDGLDGTLRSVALVCSSKCGVDAQLAVFADKPVYVRGSVIKRGRHLLLAVVENAPWIGASDENLADEPVYVQDMGRITLNGEILDAKCWSGAMRPGRGKTHKSCASLCIRLGGAPWFVAPAAQGKRTIMVLAGPKGEAIRQEVLPFVGEPVRAKGRLVRLDDQVQFRIDPARIQMI